MNDNNGFPLGIFLLEHIDMDEMDFFEDVRVI